MAILKRICIISAIFPPEPQISARMSYDLANYFADRDYDVMVLCPQPSRPITVDYSRYSNSDAPVIMVENNVKVVRLPSFASPESRLLPRMWESYSFGKEVAKYLVENNVKPDVMYVNVWPFFAQAVIARFAKKNAVPMVLQIMDIYPEALTGKLPAFLRSLIHAPLRRLDTFIARTATTVVVISENMRKIYTKGRHIPADSVVTIHTWQDEISFDNVLPRSECCSSYGIFAHLFTFLYLGNVGPVAGVDFLIRAFATAGIPNAQLLIIGDGVAKNNCVRLVEQLNLSHVYFISDSDASNVPILQNMAHVCMLPMKQGAGLSSIPSKLPSYLFSAKPVIATVDLESDTSHFVHQAECGWVGEAENLNWLVSTMKEVSQMPLEQLEIIGQQGRSFGLTHFSKSSGVVRLGDAVIQSADVKHDS